MKVLIVGMSNVPNQFTRAMDSYEGVEWEHVDSNPNGHIPRCDTAILCTCQLSHEKFYQAKAAMKLSGKPFFVTHSSFTKIKQDFEDLMRAKGMKVEQKLAPTAKRITVMGDALNKATGNHAKLAEVMAAPMKPSQKAFRKVVDNLCSEDPVLAGQLGNCFFITADGNTVVLGIREAQSFLLPKLQPRIKEINAAIIRVMGTAHNAVKILVRKPTVLPGELLYDAQMEWIQEGLTQDQMIERLNEMNIVTKTGVAWQKNNLSANRCTYGKKAEAKLAEEREKKAAIFKPAVKVPPRDVPPQVVTPPNASDRALNPAPTPTLLSATAVPEAPKVPAAPRVPTTPDELRVRDELISKVLAMKDFTPLKKLELIEEINAGVRTVEHQVIAERKGDKLQLTAQSIFHPEDKALLVMDKALARDIVSTMEAIKKFSEE